MMFVMLPAPPPGGESFASYMTRVAPLFATDAAGMQMKMSQALKTNGLSAIGQLAAAPELIAKVDASLQALIAAAAVPA